MGDLATLAKARRELEELYLGVPDESVNLTFQDFAEVKQQHSEKKRSASPSMNPISEGSSSTTLTKLPSLDFNRALHQHNHRHHQVITNDTTTHDSSRAHHHHHHASPYTTPRRDVGFRHAVDQSGMAHDDVSIMSVASMSPYDQGRGGRRRPGIPHSNICTVCSLYIYIFRHRCLVCGRVYCRQCASVGMGEMTEGRKCIECLGRRFSQRYIQRAGQVGCCMRSSSMVKQQELKWAEKGPRRSGERGNGRSSMMSRSRSPVNPRTPTRAHHASSSPPSFVMNSPYSAYSPTNHPLPI